MWKRYIDPKMDREEVGIKGAMGAMLLTVLASFRVSVSHSSCQVFVLCQERGVGYWKWTIPEGGVGISHRAG